MSAELFQMVWLQEIISVNLKAGRYKTVNKQLNVMIVQVQTGSNFLQIKYPKSPH